MTLTLVNMTLAASGHYTDTDVMAFRGLWKTWSIKARPGMLHRKDPGYLSSVLLEH